MASAGALEAVTSVASAGQDTSESQRKHTHSVDYSFSAAQNKKHLVLLQQRTAFTKTQLC